MGHHDRHRPAVGSQMVVEPATGILDRRGESTEREDLSPIGVSDGGLVAPLLGEHSQPFDQGTIDLVPTERQRLVEWEHSSPPSTLHFSAGRPRTELHTVAITADPGTRGSEPGPDPLGGAGGHAGVPSVGDLRAIPGRMIERDLEVRLEGIPARFRVRGPRCRGDRSVLLDADDDLTSGTEWADLGFTLAPLAGSMDLERVRARVRTLLGGALETAGAPPGDDWSLTRYHRWVDDDRHARVHEGWGPYHEPADLGIDVERLADRVGEVAAAPLEVLSRPGAPPAVGLRICRPGALDNNPPHRDAWIDRLRDALNVYVPLVGSTGRSSLPLAPGSHRWPESWVERTKAGATVDGVDFTVPAVTASDPPLDMVRPDPAEGEMLVFSPYLIHGGARNLEEDVTRMSLEVRFQRRAGG